MAIKPSFKTMILASAALLPLGHSALAQDATNTSARNSVIETVTVTATRQEELLSRVPASVSAFTPEKMDVLGVKNFGDIARFTPGVNFNTGSNAVSIRGISSTSGAGTTGIYIDDTPVQMRGLGFGTVNALPTVFDLQRVEVLRGPQGTLFGAGSEGGTIRYITPQPSLTDYTAYARSEFSYTQYGAPSYEAGAAFGGPIIDNVLGFRVSLWGRRDGGWISKVDTNTGRVTDRDANSTETYVVRGALTWQPTAGLLLTPTFEYQSRNVHDDDSYWVGLSNPGKGKYFNGTPDRLGDPDHFWLASLKGEYDLGSVGLFSNTSYFKRYEPVNGYSGTMYNLGYFQQIIDPTQDGGAEDPQGNACPQCNTAIYPLLRANGINLPGMPYYTAPATTSNWQDNFTQEIRIQSTDPTARLRWVAGVFYAFNSQESREEINDPQLDQISQYLFGEDILTAWGAGLLPNGDDYINDTIGHDRQIAGFINANYEIIDGVRVIAGARIARTHFDFRNYADGAQNFGFSSGEGKQDETPFTPMLGMSWQATDDDMFYATYSRGYRVGGANPPIPVGACHTDLENLGITKSPDTFASDTVSNYEVGAKNKLLGGRMSLDSSVYHLEWNNIQQTVNLPICGIRYTANLGKAASNGFDTQIQFQLNESLGFELALGYNDAYYTTATHSSVSPSSRIVINKGDSLGATPWRVAGAIQYNWTLLDHDAFFRLDDEYSSGPNRPTQSLDPVNASYDPALLPVPATNFLSARASINLGAYNVALFMDNVLNAHPQLTYSHEARGELYQATTFRPRTMGVTATFRY